MSGPPSRRTAAFTLIELLVVIAIIGVLAAIALPVLNYVQRSSQSTKCLSNLKQLGAGAFAFAADHNQILPNIDVGSEGNSGHLYPEFVWPYVTPIKYVGYAGYNEPTQFVSTVFHCPEVVNDAKDAPILITALRSYGMNYYMGHSGNGTPNTGMRLTNVPHPPTTMLFCDSYNNTYAYAWQLAKRHQGRCNVVYCDGHAEKIVPTTAMTGNTGTYATGDPFWGDLTINPNQ